MTQNRSLTLLLVLLASSFSFTPAVFAAEEPSCTNQSKGTGTYQIKSASGQYCLDPESNNSSPVKFSDCRSADSQGIILSAAGRGCYRLKAAKGGFLGVGAGQSLIVIDPHNVSSEVAAALWYVTDIPDTKLFSLTCVANCGQGFGSARSDIQACLDLVPSTDGSRAQVSKCGPTDTQRFGLASIAR
jgi:hypothetical protein